MPRGIDSLYVASSAGVGAYRALRGLRERYGPQSSGVGGSVSGAQVVKVKMDGGVGGSETTPCTFTYGIWPEDGDVNSTTGRLAAGLTPQIARRSALGTYQPAATGSYGLAKLIGESWVLLMVNEFESVGLCPPPT